MDDALRSGIQAVVEPVLAEQSAELVELSFGRQGRQLVVRLLVDKVGGVTIHDCSRLNQLVGQALETSSLLNESYLLEVSSPGLDRPLTSKRDFERAIGEELDVHLREPQPPPPGATSGAWELHGMLLAVQHEAIVVTTPGGNVTVPLAQVRSASKTIRIGKGS